MLIGTISGFLLWIAYLIAVLRYQEPWEQLNAAFMLVALAALGGIGFTLGLFVETLL